jgi:hypothetical protein
MINVQEILKAIEVYVRGWIQEMGGTPGSGGYASNPHDLNSSYHTGGIGDSQAPQFSKTDGSRILTGNQAVADGVTIDGVDVSAHKNATDEHAAATAAAGHAGGVGEHNHQAAAGGGQLDHGSALTGLGDDDHAQYLTTGRHDTQDRHPLGTVVAHDDHANLTGLGDDDHPQYLLADGARAVAGNLVPDATDARDLGSAEKLWRKGWLSELDALVFAQNAQTLIGGYLMIGKGEGTLAADVEASDTTIDFGQAMTAGDIVCLRAAGQVEYVEIGTLASGTVYNVTRNLDGSGANAWPAGGVYAVMGQEGDGRIVLNAVETPRMQILLQGAAYNLADEMVRLGDLNGSFGITSALFGIGIGDYSNGNYLRYDPTNGFWLRGGAGKVGIDGDGISLIQCASIDSYGNGPFAIKWKIDYGGFETSTIFAYTINAAQVNRLRIEARFPWDMGETDFGSGEVELKSWATSNGEINAIFATATFGVGGLALAAGSGAPKQKISLDGRYLPLPDGWAPVSGTWAYVNATTIQATGDYSGMYQVGDCWKHTQSSTVRYYYITGVSYSSGTGKTTITLNGGSDYTVANATISDAFYSHGRAMGFPEVFAWTPVCTGFSSAPTFNATFTISGGMCHLVVFPAASGTSNSAAFTMTVPVKSRGSTVYTYGTIAKLVNGGNVQSTPGMIELPTNSTVMNLYTNSNNGAWTASGGKYVYLSFSYPIK